MLLLNLPPIQHATDSLPCQFDLIAPDKERGITEDRIEEVRIQIQQLPPKPNLILRDGEFENMQRRVGC